jgi:hypothetical protein
MQDCVTLTVTEAELMAATQCAQVMLFVMGVLESMDLKVRKPMILEVDNKGAKDLAHNWTIGGRICHVDVNYHFLRELKENGINWWNVVHRKKITVICSPKIWQQLCLRNMLKFIVLMRIL